MVIDVIGVEGSGAEQANSGEHGAIWKAAKEPSFVGNVENGNVVCAFRFIEFSKIFWKKKTFQLPKKNCIQINDCHSDQTVLKR